MPEPRILVVENEPFAAVNLRDQLTQFGYEVPDPVATGDHALRTIEESRPDLILMDIDISGDLDGIATASRIPPSYRIPVIYLTDRAEDSTVERASSTSPYGYLLKPFSGQALHAMIQVTLARCRAEHASRAALEYRRQSQKMQALGQLARGVADGFNSLLSVIYGQLEVLSNHAAGQPAIAEAIQDVFGETVEKERLIRRLLAFSGQRKLAPGPVAVASVVTNVINRFADEAGHLVLARSNLPRDLWNVNADATQFESALFNLAINARDAMPGGGRLNIEARNTTLEQDRPDLCPELTSGDYVLVAVSDTGAGMPDHVMERAFEPFFTTKRNRGGGFGLSMAFGFARQSGGHIGIDSEPGRGTTVSLWLPAIKDAATAVPRTDSDYPLPDREVAGMPWPPVNGAAPRPNGTRHAAGCRPGIHSRAAGRVRPRRDSEVPVAWQKSEDALFASFQSSPESVRYHLIVEQLPRRSSWDWAVWQHGQAGETPRHGRASSVANAMVAAEAAAREWAETVLTED